MKKIDEINIQSESQSTIENFELTGSGFRFEGVVKMDKTFSQTEKNGGTLYFDLVYNHRFNYISSNHNDNYCFFGVFSRKYIFQIHMFFFLGIYEKQFNTVEKDNNNLDDRLQIKVLPELENLKDICNIVFEFDNLK